MPMNVMVNTKCETKEFFEDRLATNPDVSNADLTRTRQKEMMSFADDIMSEEELQLEGISREEFWREAQKPSCKFNGNVACADKGEACLKCGFNPDEAEIRNAARKVFGLKPTIRGNWQLRIDKKERKTIQKAIAVLNAGK